MQENLYLLHMYKNCAKCLQTWVILASINISLSFLAELGDFNPDECKDGYLSEYRFIPNQTEEFEKAVAENHQIHR